MNDDDDEYAELFRPRQPPSATTWEDVAREVGALGKTLGDALRGAWEQPTHTTEFGTALASLVDDVSHAIDQGAASPEVQRARDGLTQLSASLRTALEQAGDELRPELVTLLRQANAELRRLTSQSDAD